MAKSKKAVGSLNSLLANYQVFYQNARGFHWNIQGKHFFELHVKFEELYNDAALKIDEVAERILTINGKPLHTFKDYLKEAVIEPQKNISDAESAVKAIVVGLETLIEIERTIQEIAEQDNDTATVDLVSSFIEEQEKTLWMYNAWLR